MESVINSDSLSDEKNNLCRVCLLTNEGNKCIFTSQVNFHHEIYSPTDLREKLQFYGGIEVVPNDGLPGKMCNECISRLHIAHEFRMQCQATDNVLKSIRGDAAKKNDVASGWVGGLEDETERECVRCNETTKLKELYNDSSTDNTVEINAARGILENSENEISSCVDKICHVNSSSKINVSQSRTIHVSKRHKENTDRKSCQAYKKLPESLDSESKYSESLPEDSANDIPGDKANKDRSVSKKEEYRSRRLILFKRATSMTNLRHNKERQRRYIKKTLFAESESNDCDNTQRAKTSCVGARQLPVTLCNLHHKCSKCARSYSSKTALELHEISHEKKKFSCDQCDERFNKLDEFIKHAKFHDRSDKLTPASCKICNKNFRKAVTMVRHLNVHKRENPRAVFNILKDIRDSRKETKFREYSVNSEYFEDKIILSDSQDDNRTTQEKIADLQENRVCIPEMTNVDSKSANHTKTFDNGHSPSRDEMKFTCSVCNATFLAADKLKLHTEYCRHYGENASWEESPTDDRSAIKLINIWIKEELDSDNEGKGFPCKKCGKSYATKKSLLKHDEKMHSNLITECCPRCGKDCLCTDRIKEKQKKIHEKAAYTCEECDKTFEKEAKLEKHTRIHARAKEQQDTNFKRFLCHICSKTFRQNTGLMFHMRTHTGYKPHVCKYCGRGFTSNSNCINHERTHTGDRPFVCHYCSAAFAKSCTLKAHITTHTGEANYHCKTCGKSFRRLKYLKEHRFTHTGEKPYACKICGTAYSHSGSLFVHEKKCRVQEGNYQAISETVSLNYRQPLTASNDTESVAPIITSLLASHRINSMDNPLNADATKDYIESAPSINNSLVHSASDSAGSHIHLNPDTADVPSAVTTFTIAGQMFHT